MSERDYAPLSTACVRGLCDKLYEKRKFAGVEIEKMVKDFNDANNTNQIKKLIRVLGQDLMSSTNPNVKNGALMGLSSVAVGLGKGCTVYLSELLHPIVACVSEGESRVRYLAAEALFNVLKIARGASLSHFPLVFDALARLASDPEPQVRQGAELLDRLVKDIVTESGAFDVSAFVPLLRERLYARGACARQFAAAWVSALDALPALPLLPHLRDLLDPMLHMLDEPHPEIRRMYVPPHCSPPAPGDPPHVRTCTLHTTWVSALDALPRCLCCRTCATCSTPCCTWERAAPGDPPHVRTCTLHTTWVSALDALPPAAAAAHARPARPHAAHAGRAAPGDPPHVRTSTLRNVGVGAGRVDRTCVSLLDPILHMQERAAPGDPPHVRTCTLHTTRVSALDALPLLPHMRDLLDPMLHMLDEPHPEIRRMYVLAHCAWVSMLDMLPHLRVLLDPILHMLDEPHPEIRRMCEVQLNEFLRSIKKDPSQVDFQSMINILITHAQSPEELVQLTAITWIKEFVELAGPSMLPYASGILCAVLPCLAYSDEARKNIRETAATVNFQLTKLVTSSSPESTPAPQGTEEDEAIADKTLTESDTNEDQQSNNEGKLNLDAVVRVLTQMLHHSSVHTKVAVLDWILHLYNKLPTEMYGHTEAVFSRVVGSLADAADDVLRRALAVLAEICSCPGDLESSPYYYKFLQALLKLLAADENLLEDRGAFIIRQLCVLLNAEDIYKALSKILLEEKNLRFAAVMVDVLNTILLTAAELYDLRLQLRNMEKPGTMSLFRSLYLCWCHSPVSLLALCLLTHHYAHCNRLIATFGDLEITVDFLTEVDKLVQLIESPIFAYLRLELLGGAQSEALRGALFGLLMLLPQSDAFHALRHRLHAAPHHPYLSRVTPSTRCDTACTPHRTTPTCRGAYTVLTLHLLVVMLLPQSDAFHALRHRLHAAPHHPYLLRCVHCTDTASVGGDAAAAE
ncbi:unnamed protein product [Parnassius apollo]|uniref:(apollo) hypothetical protein n=1 Tax=Parnassius apollo TaxID=110799 RepID=A0A8S3Y6Y6_PARAO|nr:unnamed protein product [Parnassius apollo]